MIYLLTLFLFISSAFANDPIQEIKTRADALHGSVTKRQIIDAQLDLIRLIQLVKSYELMCEGFVEFGELKPDYKDAIYIAVFEDYYKGNSK